MLVDIIRIAIICVIAGSISIPVSFGINPSPWVVWVGNALGSLLSAFVVIYIGDRIMSNKFRIRISRSRIGKKIVIAFDEGSENKNVIKAQGFINQHGLKLFALFCPIFPGVLLSTVSVYLLGLDKQTYKRWMFAGVVFVSGGYVFSYWLFFVK